MVSPGLRIATNDCNGDNQWKDCLILYDTILMRLIAEDALGPQVADLEQTIASRGEDREIRPCGRDDQHQSTVTSIRVAEPNGTYR